MRRRALIGATIGLGVATTVRATGAPVVLELFTSQGCSSCPPADALLGVLAQDPGIIALAWHVDYWNRLGWHDPYASRQWTERQRGYAARLGEEVYTPALVVNGVTMVVGSDRSAVQRAIVQARSLPVPVSLRRDGPRLEALIGAVPQGATASLAIYDPQRATDVSGGENTGRRLQEYRIVRDIRPVDPAAGRITLSGVPDTQGAALLVQDAGWRVCGAAAV